MPSFFFFFFIDVASSSPASNVSVSVAAAEGMIIIVCTFFDPELTGCVGVIHSAQLENLTLTVLSVERSVGMNWVSIREGNYSVAVFGQKERKLDLTPALVKTILINQPRSKKEITGLLFIG